MKKAAPKAQKEKRGRQSKGPAIPTAATLRPARRMAICLAVCLAIFLAVCVALAIASDSRELSVTHYELTSRKLSAPVRLALVTDLHGTDYGDNQEELAAAIRAQSPDALLMAGDMADKRRPLDGLRRFLTAMEGEYPAYFVCGNHEYQSGQARAVEALMRRYGAEALNGDMAALEIRGQVLQVCGVADPDGFLAASTDPSAEPESWQGQLERCRARVDSRRFSLLLSHRPELAAFYRDSGFDLVVSGHAHGGQARLPGLIDGLYAPDQGLFPAYTKGVYPLGGTTLVVSAGLCRNALPRPFNPPELVIIDLKPAGTDE